jgi:hypothetical protein
MIVLIKQLVQRSRATNLSYDNLVGNFRDGDVGKKVKAQIFSQFFSKHNPDKEFAD